MQLICRLKISATHLGLFYLARALHVKGTHDRLLVSALAFFG